MPYYPRPRARVGETELGIDLQNGATEVTGCASGDQTRDATTRNLNVLVLLTAASRLG